MTSTQFDAILEAIDADTALKADSQACWACFEEHIQDVLDRFSM